MKNLTRNQGVALPEYGVIIVFSALLLFAAYMLLGDTIRDFLINFGNSMGMLPG